MSLCSILPLLGLLGLVLASPVAAAPSFDCAKASGWVEHTVCAQGSLADLDRQLAELYAAQRSAVGPVGEAPLRDAQRAWARGRAACERRADSIACLERHYRQRSAELGGGVELPGWASGLAAAIPAIDACLAATPSAAVVVTDLQPDGDGIRLTLRGANGRGFACRAPRDGRGMVSLHDASASPDGSAFRRGSTNPCRRRHR